MTQRVTFFICQPGQRVPGSLASPPTRGAPWSYADVYSPIFLPQRTYISTLGKFIITTFRIKKLPFINFRNVNSFYKNILENTVFQFKCYFNVFITIGISFDK